jgi:hypothetical protein
MQLKSWLAGTDMSIQVFARKVKIQRAMIYRYFSGTLPRAKTIRRIEILTEGAVTAQDFYASALERMNEAEAREAARQRAVDPKAPVAHATPVNTSRLEAATGDAPNLA